MKTLIIHDRDEVAEELGRICQELVGDEAAQIDFAKDVFTARDQLREKLYDVVTIDLTLPIKHGNGEASIANADLLLQEIFEGGDVKAPGDVLGISRDIDALDLIATKIGQHLMACIHEDGQGLWKQSFAAKLKYVLKAGRARQLVANAAHDMDLVIVVALDKEAQPYETLFELSPSDRFPRALEFSFRSADEKMRRGVLYAIGQPGQAPCASATQALLTQFRPRLMLMTGFCGGVKGRTNMGDLVAFRSSAAWDYGKWVEVAEGDQKKSLFKARPTTINIPENGVRQTIRDMVGQSVKPREATLAAVSAASNGKLTSWKIESAACGSGSAVVTSLEKIREITSLDENIWAIDMESYAFYFACRNSPVISPDFICCKAVADHCNGQKSSRLHEACSIVSAHFAHQIVTERYPF